MSGHGHSAVVHATGSANTQQTGVVKPAAAVDESAGAEEEAALTPLPGSQRLTNKARATGGHNSLSIVFQLWG